MDDLFFQMCGALELHNRQIHKINRMLQRQIANNKKTYVLLAMFTAYCVLNESYKIHYEERIKQLDKEIEMLKQQKGEL